MLYRFLNYELDIRRRTLRRGGATVETEPKVFELLMLLVQSEGRMLGKDELHDTLWPGEFVTETALSRCVSRARAAIGDDGRSQRCIKTHHRQGFRFLPSVEPLADDGPLEDKNLPFTGRTEGLAALSDSLELAALGPRAVLISGEPGIGKTRLIEEQCDRARESGLRVLRGGCEREQWRPFQPFVELLEDAAAHYKEELPDWSSRPALRRLVAGHDGDAHQRAAGDEDAIDERESLGREYTQWLVSAAEPGPLIVVVDDLHWASGPSIALLLSVLTRLRDYEPRAPILFVVALRDTEPLSHERVFRDLAASAGEQATTHLPLSGLPLASVERLVEWEGGDGEYLDEQGLALARRLHGRSAGNPLILGELLLRGELVHSPEGDLLGANHPIAWLRTRIASLPSRVRAVLSVAACMGRSFRRSEIAEVLGLSVGELEGAVNEARACGLVEASEPAHPRFRHDLVREALDADLSEKRRADTHRLLAQSIVSLRGEHLTPFTAELALHYEVALPGEVDGDEAARASFWGLAAGRQAMAHLAPEDALRWLEPAMQRLAEDASPELLCEIGITLGEAEFRAGRPGHRDTLLAAGRLSSESGLDEALIRSVLAN